MIVLIDNYDSFTYNLWDYFMQLYPAGCQLVRNDEASIESIKALEPKGVVFSPGPQAPKDHPLMFEVLDEYVEKIPILGICLGFQAIGTYFGGTMTRASTPVHGKTSKIAHKDHQSFYGIPNNFEVTRYHSLVLKDIPENHLKITSYTNLPEEIPMSIAHFRYPVWGYQFHPEAILTENGHQLLKNWLYHVN
ncbi:MAG: anthranilate/aminodeoxychorismate synthase component II [Bacteroidetes bacterium SW_10_40_5]|nr:MAG: anthranilate/aminodeoxychorismate synthase component II [Bacteroidetes bacterium SW_10_40_5]